VGDHALNANFNIDGVNAVRGQMQDECDSQIKYD
jgi:hypothetical protein